MAPAETSDPSYTVIIRLPFERGDFVDPPSVNWDASKDKHLWKILSKAAKNSDIDWNALADDLDVSLPFLLQQAAWLYERQLSQVRAQMRKVGNKPSQSPFPYESAGGETMKRAGSGGGGPQTPSYLVNRKDSPIQKLEAGNLLNRSQAPPLSRTSSTSTAIAMHSRNLLQTSPRPAKAQLHRLSMSPPSRPSTILKNQAASSSDSSDSGESDSSESGPAQSRLIRRTPRFSSAKLAGSEGADGDDEGPAFLPFSGPAEPHITQDPSETLREDPRNTTKKPHTKRSGETIQLSQTSDSSASSTAKVPARLPPRRDTSHTHHTGPLSPRRTAELAGRGPSSKGKTGSDDSPSMGSSFSDLDDISITQSALEEALASNIQQGGGASRMSTISQALRSRYL